MSGAGALVVVSTPIGHLADLSPRAAEALRDAHVVLAEDTRHTRHLLDHAGIRTPLESLHEHNEAARTAGVLARLAEGQTLALVSDAGTPLVSDPGERLVRAVVAAGHRVVPVPGPSALLAALVGSGLPTDAFTFLGFLPRKGRERAARVREVVRSPHTVVLYEAPGRVAETLADLAQAGAGDRPATLARELTKQYEEFVRDTVQALAARYAAEPPRGEVVLVVGGAPPAVLDEDALRARAAALRAQGLRPSEVARRLVDEAGAPRNLAYALAHA